MTSQERQRRVSALLHKTAEEIPAQIDLMPSIRARIERALDASPATSGTASRSSHNPTAGTRSLPRWGRPAVALLVVAVLLLSAFAFARPLISTWLGDSGLKQIALQDGTPIKRTVTTHGITLFLEEGYADAARTALTMRISMTGTSGTSGTSGTATPVLSMARLTDAQHHVYVPFTGTQVEQDGLYEFLPLPAAELGAPQTLTLVVETMELTDASTQISGPWQISFVLRPQAGRVVPLAPAPQSHSVVTLTPLRMDLAPSGLRLLVRVSGLKADTSLFSLTHYATYGDDIVGCPPGGGYCVGSSAGVSDGAPMHVRGPDGQTLQPGWVAVGEASSAPNGGLPRADQMVGPSGAAVLEFLFFEPLHAIHGSAQVVIEQVRISSIHADPSTPEQIVPGPWVFSLALP